jgi:hypothetical protein
MAKTSWSDNELKLLTDIDNHKMIMDVCGDVRWYNKINGKWEIHSIKVFDDFTLPYSWLYYWLYKWEKELKSRKLTQHKSDRKKRKIIRESTTMLFANKVLEMSALLPECTQKEIANELGVSVKTVQRALNKVA